MGIGIFFIETDHRCCFGSIGLLEGDCGLAIFLSIIDRGYPAIRRVKMRSSEVQGLLTFRRSCRRRNNAIRLNDDVHNDVTDLKKSCSWAWVVVGAMPET